MERQGSSEVVRRAASLCVVMPNFASPPAPSHRRAPHVHRRPRESPPAATHTGRVPVPRCRREDPLRGQGQGPAPPRGQLLRQAPPGRKDAHAGEAHRRPARDRGAHRVRGTAAGELPDQGAPATLQHQPARRQELPLHPHPQRTLPPGGRHAQPGGRRQRILRPLCQRAHHEDRAAARAQTVQAAHLQLRPQREAHRGRQVQAVPGVPHRQLQGTLRRAADRGGVRPEHPAGA